VWLDTIPLLAARGLIDALDKHALAMLCVYVGEFVAANEEVLRNGFTTRVKTVSGDYMLRENPAVSIRDTAQKVVLDISKRFGLTPLDRAYLTKVQKGADIEPNLFDHPAPAAAEEPVDPATAEWGLLLEQPPPRPN
jgi:P27 family predicted phage terminase small subunit